VLLVVVSLVVVAGGGDATLQAIGDAFGPTDRVDDPSFTFDDIFDGAHTTQGSRALEH
jgi:hypothetical protein